jgi:phage-related holin
MTFTQAIYEVKYYLSQVVLGIYWKGILGAIILFFTDFLHGDLMVLQMYLVVFVADLFLGSVRAFKEKRFEKRKLYRWILKFLTHMGSVVLVGAIGVMLMLVSGSEASLALINWYILLLFLTESGSAVNNAILLGLPVPEVAKAIVFKARKRAYKRIDEMVGDGTDPGMVENFKPPENEKDS